MRGEKEVAPYIRFGRELGNQEKRESLNRAGGAFAFAFNAFSGTRLTGLRGVLHTVGSARTWWGPKGSGNPLGCVLGSLGAHELGIGWRERQDRLKGLKDMPFRSESSAASQRQPKVQDGEVERAGRADESVIELRFKTRSIEKGRRIWSESKL